MGFDYEQWVLDGVKQWLGERVKKAPAQWHPSEHQAFADFYADYKAWCNVKRIDTLTKWRFGQEFGCDAVASKYYKRQKVYFAGIVLREPSA